MRDYTFSSYSDSELAFLIDVLTKSIELTREESKNYGGGGACKDNPPSQ
jgi:hypothetical protein